MKLKVEIKELPEYQDRWYCYVRRKWYLFYYNYVSGSAFHKDKETAVKLAIENFKKELNIPKKEIRTVKI